jgi:hypothetical protein
VNSWEWRPSRPVLSSLPYPGVQLGESTVQRLRRFCGRLGLLSTLLVLLSGMALASPYTLVLDTQKASVEGTLDGGDLYLQLIPFLQALGGGARPVKFDLTAATIMLTRGDGSKTVAAAFRIPSRPPVVWDFRPP